MVSMDVTATEQNVVTGLERLLTMRDVDARRGVPRRLRETVRALANDLGADLSTAQKMLVARAAMLSTLLTHAEASILLGKPDVPLADYIAMANTQRRLLATLGLKRVPRDITDPLEYAARQRVPE